MTNLATLNLTDAQLTAIDSAITELETQLSGMVALSTVEKRRAAKLGEKSEYFCRQTLRMLAENPQVIPPNLDLADAIADLDARDALRPRLMRLTRLLERGNDTDFALGSDAMAAATRGYSLLKSVSGREGLDQLRRDLGTRFTKTRRKTPDEKKAAYGRPLQGTKGPPLGGFFVPAIWLRLTQRTTCPRVGRGTRPARSPADCRGHRGAHGEPDQSATDLGRRTNGRGLASPRTEDHPPHAASPLRLRYRRNFRQPTRRNVLLKSSTDDAQPAPPEPSNTFSDPTRPAPRRTAARHQRVHTRFKQA